MQVSQLSTCIVQCVRNAYDGLNSALAMSPQGYMSALNDGTCEFPILMTFKGVIQDTNPFIECTPVADNIIATGIEEPEFNDIKDALSRIASDFGFKGLIWVDEIESL